MEDLQTKPTSRHVWAARAVIFLDADAIAVGNLDGLFRCPGFCAVLRHSERFNSGVMVLRPSELLFRDMLDRVASVESYTGCVRRKSAGHTWALTA